MHYVIFPSVLWKLYRNGLKRQLESPQTPLWVCEQGLELSQCFHINSSVFVHGNEKPCGSLILSNSRTAEDFYSIHSLVLVFFYVAFNSKNPDSLTTHRCQWGFCQTCNLLHHPSASWDTLKLPQNITNINPEMWNVTKKA